MASLIVPLHDLVNKYLRKAKNKDVAGKIASEVLTRCKEVAKKYILQGEDACMYHIALIYPIVSRELVRWNKIITRRMKPTPSLANPWGIQVVRNMPQEIFSVNCPGRTLWKGSEADEMCIYTGDRINSCTTNMGKSYNKEKRFRNK